MSGWLRVGAPLGITINTPFTNNGNLVIDTGTVTINGNYAPSATSALTVTIGGNEPGLQFGQLHVTGNLTIAGYLQMFGDPGFSPDLNDKFVLAYADGTKSGTFQSTSQNPLSTPNGMSYGITYPGKTATVTAKPGANLQVSITAPSSISVGQDITYTDVVSNSGPNPAQVTLKQAPVH